MPKTVPPSQGSSNPNPTILNPESSNTHPEDKASQQGFLSRLFRGCQCSQIAPSSSVQDLNSPQKSKKQLKQKAKKGRDAPASKTTTKGEQSVSLCLSNPSTKNDTSQMMTHHVKSAKETRGQSSSSFPDGENAPLLSKIETDTEEVEFNRDCKVDMNKGTGVPINNENGSNAGTVGPKISHPLEEKKPSSTNPTSGAPASKGNSRDSGYRSTHSTSVASSHKEESPYAREFNLFTDNILQAHEYILQAKTKSNKTDQSEYIIKDFFKKLDSLEERLSTVVNRLLHIDKGGPFFSDDSLMNNDSLKWEVIKNVSSQLTANNSDLKKQKTLATSAVNDETPHLTQLSQNLLEKIKEIFESNESEINNILEKIENKNIPEAAAVAPPNNAKEQEELLSPANLSPLHLPEFNEPQPNTFSPDTEPKKDTKNPEVSLSFDNEGTLSTQSNESDNENSWFSPKIGSKQKLIPERKSKIFDDLPSDDELFHNNQASNASKKVEIPEINVSAPTQDSNSEIPEGKINGHGACPSDSKPNHDTPSTSRSENCFKESINGVLNKTHASQSKGGTDPSSSISASSRRFRESADKIAQLSSCPSKDSTTNPSSSISASSRRFRQSVTKTAQLSSRPSKKPEDERDYLSVLRERLSERIARYYDSSSDEEVTCPAPITTCGLGYRSDGSVGVVYYVNGFKTN